MKNPTMLYKAGGKKKIHGGLFDYIVVDGDDNEKLEQLLSEGWHKTTEEAESAKEDASEEPKLSEGATHCPVCGSSFVEDEGPAQDQGDEAGSVDSEDQEPAQEPVVLPADENPLSGKTREELESIAEAMEADHEGLNIAYNARTSDENLATKILEAKKSLESAEV